MESQQPAADDTLPDPGSIGALDVATLRPMRTLVTAKIVSMLVVILLAVGAGVLLAPQVGAALGFAPRVQATVLAITPLPVEDSAAGGCQRVQVRVSWDVGAAGTFAGCAEGSDPVRSTVPGGQPVAVGDSLTVHALDGWSTVTIGPRWPNVVLTAMLLLVIAAAGVGLVRYWRERAVLAGLGAGEVASSAPPIRVRLRGSAMAFDVLTMGKGPGGGRGRRATVQLDAIDADVRSVRLQIPGATEPALRWRQAWLVPVGRTRRGRPSGPYLVLTPQGILVASGRALRSTTAGA